MFRIHANALIEPFPRLCASDEAQGLQIHIWKNCGTLPMMDFEIKLYHFCLSKIYANCEYNKKLEASKFKFRGIRTFLP